MQERLILPFFRGNSFAFFRTTERGQEPLRSEFLDGRIALHNSSVETAGYSYQSAGVVLAVMTLQEYTPCPLLSLNRPLPTIRSPYWSMSVAPPDYVA